MEIIEKKVEELIPYDNNPRKNDEAVDKVAESIKEFGFKVPIVIDSNDVIVTGHTRLKAAKKLGLKSVPCIQADDLTDEQIKAFRLADNKVSEFSVWNLERLDEELESIDIYMERFGFTDDQKVEVYEEEEATESDFVTLSFQLHEEQKSFIEESMQKVAEEITETFGNTNKNGNSIYEIVRQWTEQRK